MRRHRAKPDASDSFPGYAEVTEIGSGAFASVYRAIELATQRPVALKVLKVSARHPHVMEAFDREVKALGALSSHPNIVTLYRSLTTPDGRPVLVLELCRESVAARVRREGPIPPEEAVAIGIKIAGALETAHRGGLLHRDMKPQNILITEYHEPALADFGVAALQASAQSVEGVFGFTTLHAPPEVLEGHRLSRGNRRVRPGIDHLPDDRRPRAVQRLRWGGTGVGDPAHPAAIPPRRWDSTPSPSCWPTFWRARWPSGRRIAPCPAPRSPTPSARSRPPAAGGPRRLPCGATLLRWLRPGPAAGPTGPARVASASSARPGLPRTCSSRRPCGPASLPHPSPLRRSSPTPSLAHASLPHASLPHASLPRLRSPRPAGRSSTPSPWIPRRPPTCCPFHQPQRARPPRDPRMTRCGVAARSPHHPPDRLPWCAPRRPPATSWRRRR